jgi:hypothetical protein
MIPRKAIRNSCFRRRHRTGAAGDQAVMLNAAMTGEVEDRFLAERGGIEIARVNQKFVLFGPGFDGAKVSRDRSPLSSILLVLHQ